MQITNQSNIVGGIHTTLAQIPDAGGGSASSPVAQKMQVLNAWKSFNGEGFKTEV